MKKGILLYVAAVLSLSLTFGYITDALDNWTLGTSSPEIISGARPTGDSGPYLHLLVGTSPMYYEVAVEGEGAVDFWLYDPGKCLEVLDPGYGYYGPIWGLQSLLYQSMNVGINRKDYIQGCRGYNVWSTVAPYSPWWFCEFYGLRGTYGAPFTAGWYLWSVYGTWDDATFTLYNVTHFENADTTGNFVTGDLSQTIDATSFDGGLGSCFGDGWKAFYLKGDEASGIEDYSVIVTGGTGVFSEFGASASTPCVNTNWGAVKNLFR